MRNIFQRPFAENIICGYLEMGKKALAYGQFKVASKMFKAAFEEPAATDLKQKYLIPILLSMAESHEGQKQLYKAKLLYIRVLAHHRKRSGVMDMFCVRILLRLARLTARQNLFRQSCEFLEQANQCFSGIDLKRSDDRPSGIEEGCTGGTREEEFAAALWELERIFCRHGRDRERKSTLCLIELLCLKKPEDSGFISRYSTP